MTPEYVTFFTVGTGVIAALYIAVAISAPPLLNAYSKRGAVWPVAAVTVVLFSGAVSMVAPLGLLFNVARSLPLHDEDSFVAGFMVFGAIGLLAMAIPMIQGLRWQETRRAADD